MNFDLDADDRALQAAIRDVCARHFPMERVRGLARVDPSSWRALEEAGVFSLIQPEAVGGAGLGMTHAVLVFEELGRFLVPGPLVATFLGARWGGGVAQPTGIVSRVVPHMIEHAESVDRVLVVDRGGAYRFALSAADAVAREPLDPLTPVSELRALPSSDMEQIAGPDDAARAYLEGAALTAALALGIAAATTEAATAYAKERVQFGRAIGSFQAVKHMLADMLVRAEVARAAVYAAGCALDDASGDARTAVATAKLLACEAALVNGKTSIQVHGGMGFTWEVDAHLYVKRAAVLATHFGDAASHAREMANTLS